MYPADAFCRAGDQMCSDSIQFRAIGAITQHAVEWVDRPTFQQADELVGKCRSGPAPASSVAPGGLPTVPPMLRVEDCVRPAGGSPVRVSVGAPGSRPQFVVERRRAERGVESLFGGSKRAGWNCSPVTATIGESSCSFHGEDPARQVLVPDPGYAS